MDIQTWMINTGILDELSLALAAAKEEDVDAKVFAVAKADGTDVTRLADQLAVRRTWWACRQIMQTPQNGVPHASAPTNASAPVTGVTNGANAQAAATEHGVPQSATAEHGVPQLTLSRTICLSSSDIPTLRAAEAARQPKRSLHQLA